MAQSWTYRAIILDEGKVEDITQNPYLTYSTTATSDADFYEQFENDHDPDRYSVVTVHRF